MLSNTPVLSTHPFCCSVAGSTTAHAHLFHAQLPYAFPLVLSVTFHIFIYEFIMMKTFVFGAVALSFASSAFAVDFVDPKTIDPKKWYTIAPTDVNTALLDSCSSRGCFIIHDDATDPMKLKDNGAKWQFPDAKDGSLGKIMNGGNNNCLGVTYDAEHGNALLVTKDSKSCATAKVNDQGQLTIQADQNNFVAKVGEQDDYYGQEAKEEQLSKTAAVLGALEASAPAAGERRRSRVYGNNNVN